MCKGFFANKSQIYLYHGKTTPYRIAANRDHIFEEKVGALLVRGKARDLYDLWFLKERGIKPDLELINSKLSLYNKIYSWDDVLFSS